MEGATALIGQILDPSNYILSPHAIPVFATGVASLLLGIGVVVQERASRESVLFLLLTVLVSLWLVAFSGMYSAREPGVALWWGRAAYIGLPMIAPAVYHFAVVLLRVYASRKTIVRLAWSGSAAFTGLLLGTDLMLTGLYRYDWGFYVRFSVYSIPYVLFFVGLLGLALHEYRRAYGRASTRRQRSRIKWLALSFGIGYLALVDYLPSFGIGLQPVGYIPILGFLALAGWTVQRFRLVDLTPAFAAEEIVETMVDPMLVCDADGRIQYANTACARAVGYDDSELRRIRIDSIIESLSEEPASVTHSLLRTTVRDSEYRLRSRSGERIAVSLSSSPLYDRDRNCVGSVVIARDIRERKKMALQLQDSERRLRLLLENVIDYGMVMLDPEGHVESWNEGAQQIFGYTADEIVGEHVSAFFPQEDVRRGKPARELRVARERGRFEETAWRVHKSGERLWANMVVTPIEEPAGELIGFAKVVRDLTERRELEQQLLQSQKMEAIGRLAGGVAHDFNNLLTVISGHTQLLLHDSPGGDDLVAELTRIKQAADRAASLTRQMLAFSRRQVIQPRVLDINQAVSDVEQMLRRLIGENIELVTALDAERPQVEADRGQLEQVIMNLAVNARDAMPDGGKLIIETADAVISSEYAEKLELEPGPHILLAVTDTGTGMDRETLARVYEPFFTTKARDRGTGLGLSTVHGIVKQSGGGILAYSEPGHGTSFKVYFPRSQESLDTHESEECERVPEGSETVLLVEDDVEVRDLIRTLLLRCGYRVLEAGSTGEAVSVFEERPERVDLLLTDVILPDRHGRELADRLRRHRPGLPIVYMSGYTEYTIGENGVLEPDTRLLQKPFTLEALSQEIREAIDEVASEVGSPDGDGTRRRRVDECGDSRAAGRGSVEDLSTGPA